MLGKLIKHDFKSLSKVLFPTQIAVVGATIIATLGFAFNVRSGYSQAEAFGFMNLIRLLTGFLSAMMLLAIIAASVLVAFMIFQRFYKNLMCDEGYLTFTLPVTTSEILWSKLITATLWTIISSVVIVVCVNIFMLFGTADSGIMNLEVYRQIGKALAAVNETIGARVIWPILEFGLLMLVSTVNKIFQVYLAIIIGGVVSQKHKILASIGFYFVISIAVSMLASIAQFFLSGQLFGTAMTFDSNTFAGKSVLEIYNLILGAAQPYYWFYLVFVAALTAGFFVLSHYLLKNKLNLE